MPHVIQAADIPLEERRPHMVAYMVQVRRALLDPSLPTRSRIKLQAQLDRLKTDLRQTSPR